MVLTATAGAMDAGRPGLGALIGRAPWVWRLVSLAMVCLLWEYGGRSNFNWAFPSFLETLAGLREMVADGSLGRAYLRTLEPLALGLVLSVAVGMGAGVAMGLRREAEWFVLPLFVTAQAAPMAALIPLVTFVYGIGLASKVLAVMILATPVIAINSYKAVRNVPPSLTAMSRSFMGSRLQTVIKVVLPAASPMMFAGLRLGVAEGFSGVVLAELLITPTGIGDLITYHRSIANFGHM